MKCLKHHAHLPITIVNENFRWLHEINDICENASRILVGSKCEDPEKRAVAYEDAFKAASQSGMQYMETSSKDNINVEEVFQAIARLALNAKKAQRDELAKDKAENIRVIVKEEKKIVDRSKKCC